MGVHGDRVSDQLEGWYTDPYALHEARWMSEGKPTKLVRDAGVESYDEPPDEPPKCVPERIVTEARKDGSDLKRADDAEREDPYDPKKAYRKAQDYLDSFGPFPF
jgi:hypothetical protein